MRTAFADTGYWVAELGTADQLMNRAESVTEALGEIQILTTQTVLVEVLAFVARAGQVSRRRAVLLVEELQSRPEVEIVAQSDEQFRAALARHAARPDQRWSLTDCASFLVMEERGITEAAASAARRRRLLPGRLAGEVSQRLPVAIRERGELDHVHAALAQRTLRDVGLGPPQLPRDLFLRHAQSFSPGRSDDHGRCRSERTPTEPLAEAAPTPSPRKPDAGRSTRTCSRTCAPNPCRPPARSLLFHC